ncbi:hypothetical protein MCOR07_006570 [Pyricularia oryzae]|uniref:Uncharacterized protein n=1 Tax=Pyricularia grisea TaxID=148305 RepID=A0ABQ8NG70_PYRGI|nr:hypothetical protein MCOR01_010589 [Pyricularia oryzae]KAI6296572.1 hypothetical protein MCOR33_006843 [Pyricularia grisea]KAI6371729.1 hypothetical protein MCOR31_003995 [Pyricularia oryzae]KAI6420168.1 hypothetical protein MCOR24_004774 [Pyricularia oryzae]KAI6431116.1 hypothetical protein MCOR21_004123 [Pyricularia oryzae]
MTTSVGNINGQHRTAAGSEDDGVDHIGIDTPRSGIATPQPDLQDKRLPSIMSSFGQVRYFFNLFSFSISSTTGLATNASSNNTVSGDERLHRSASGSASASSSPQHPDSPRILPSEVPELSEDKIPPVSFEKAAAMPSKELPSSCDGLSPYPTPPTSQRGSLQCGVLGDTSGEGGICGHTSAVAPSHSRNQSSSDVVQRQTAGPSKTLASVVTQPCSVLASHFSYKHQQSSAFVSSSPSRDEGIVASLCKKPASTAHPTKLTSEGKKSGHSTPTRSLSTAHASRSGSHEDKANGTSTGTSTPSLRSGEQVAAPKGKLTVKITEGRGVRKCRDPYVVAVCQRSELISGGPRTFEDEDELSVSTPLGGVLISRSGSDMGRTPMAIPMRSRQSSNTSVTEYNTFRNRTRRTFTRPKWDAEAVFDVNDKDMRVEITIWEHGANGEEFLGSVELEASKEVPLRGWFPLVGHADTVAENAPTGEIYVEALYEATGRKHYGPDDFEILKLIGKGTFGQVYQVRKRDTKRIYAMKVLSKKVIVQKKEVAHTVGERNILVRTATSNSPFIVSLKFSFQTPTDLYLVTDYMSGGELFWHLQKEGRFEEKRAKFYIAELILAIQHLHNNDIVYRDLKPENILLDATGHIALCDFGLSKADLAQNDTTNTFCGTTEYLAPEVLLDEAGYTKMVDFWSLGVLVFEMCCGWSPFYAEDTQQMYKNIAFGKVRFPKDTLSVEGRNFVKGLLNRNPKHRLGATNDAEELKQHPFFRDVDWNALQKRQITPPFKPKLKSETDVSYFDPEFTNALDTNGSLNERAAQLAKGVGYGNSTPLSPSVQANFQGFTFTGESTLEENMRDRYGNDDEDMDDFDRAKEDHDWDDLDDLNPRNGNRMSGIVRSTGNDEHMFSNSQFDM